MHNLQCHGDVLFSGHFVLVFLGMPYFDTHTHTHTCWRLHVQGMGPAQGPVLSDKLAKRDVAFSPELFELHFVWAQKE